MTLSTISSLHESLCLIVNERKINDAADVTTKVYDVFLSHDKP